MSFQSKSVVAVIQARAGSTRLPGKVLRKIAGQPSLYYVIERVKRAQTVDHIVLATTTLSQDDPVAELGDQLGVSVFRGSENDVVDRFSSSLKIQKQKFDMLVRVCADNFVVCPSVIDAAVQELVTSDLDLINPFLKPTYPYGCGAEVATLRCFDQVETSTRGKDSRFREHLFLYAYENAASFKINTLKAPLDLTWPDLRLTVDFPEEFERLKSFLESLSPEDRLECDVKEIIEYFKQC